MISKKDVRIRRAFTVAKDNARRRKIPFLLTFDQWFDIWDCSGFFERRGCRLGSYCMSRFGDVGPYAVGNVEIVSTQKNQSDATRGKRKPPMSTEQKQLLSKLHKGKPSYVRTEKTRERNRLSKLGHRWTAEQRRAMSENWHRARGLL